MVFKFGKLSAQNDLSVYPTYPSNNHYQHSTLIGGATTDGECDYFLNSKKSLKGEKRRRSVLSVYIGVSDLMKFFL